MITNAIFLSYISLWAFFLGSDSDTFFIEFMLFAMPVWFFLLIVPLMFFGVEYFFKSRGVQRHMFIHNIKESDHASPKLVCVGGLCSMVGIALFSFTETLSVVLISSASLLILIGSAFVVYAHNNKVEGEVEL